MASLQQLLQERKTYLDKADKILKAAEDGKRNFTEQEQSDIDRSQGAIARIDEQITSIKKTNTLFDHMRKGQLIPSGPGPNSNWTGAPLKQGAESIITSLSPDYPDAFMSYIQSGGKRVIEAVLYEGANASGGFVVPVMVDQQIVPLAPQEMGVRKLATVIPTTMDVKIPQQASFGTASAKAENSAFGESDPTLSQITLSAFMAGIQHTVSWELAQDVPSFQAFAIDDMILAQQMYEENLYVNGTGSGQAQGLIGNVGAGVVEEPDANGNLVSINGTLDLISKLNAVYHPNAAWLMARTTSVVIRKAQVQQNLFEPVWTRIGAQDYLHGYPVEYSSSMPAAARGNTPVLFGDFRRGYVIGDRGGSGINVKVLDQPLATQGQIILLAYRRTDGRVRRSEAIQPYYIAAS
jgi:HK97 family phage major capsid protein